MHIITCLAPGVRKGRVLAAVIAACAALLLSPGAIANAQDGSDNTPSQSQVTEQDQLIHQQEQALNAYRCQFGVDTDAVPGGCTGTQPTQTPASPGQFQGTPTQSDIDERDSLIGQQQQLLNAYRCQFGVDTDAVPGGCTGTQPTPSDTPQSVENPTPTTQSQGDQQTDDGQTDNQQTEDGQTDNQQTEDNAQSSDQQDGGGLGHPCPDQPNLTCLDDPPSGDGVTNINVTPSTDGDDSEINITKDGTTDTYEAPGFFDSEEDIETTETWKEAVDDATDDDDLVVIYAPHHEDSTEVQANKARLEQEIYDQGEPYVVCFPAVYVELEDGYILDHPESCVVVTPN